MESRAGSTPVNFAGSFAVDTQTKNQSTNEALQLIVEQLRDMQEHPVVRRRTGLSQEISDRQFSAQARSAELDRELHPAGRAVWPRPRLCRAISETDRRGDQRGRPARGAEILASRRAHPGCGGQPIRGGNQYREPKARRRGSRRERAGLRRIRRIWRIWRDAAGATGSPAGPRRLIGIRTGRAASRACAFGCIFRLTSRDP